jgi:hypothetical protein
MRALCLRGDVLQFKTVLVVAHDAGVAAAAGK